MVSLHSIWPKARMNLANSNCVLDSLYLVVVRLDRLIRTPAAAVAFAGKISFASLLPTRTLVSSASRRRRRPTLSRVAAAGAQLEDRNRLPAAGSPLAGQQRDRCCRPADSSPPPARSRVASAGPLPAAQSTAVAAEGPQGVRPWKAATGPQMDRCHQPAAG
jgi:hypothetical protein